MTIPEPLSALLIIKSSFEASSFIACLSKCDRLLDVSLGVMLSIVVLMFCR